MAAVNGVCGSARVAIHIGGMMRRKANIVSKCQMQSTRFICVRLCAVSVFMYECPGEQENEGGTQREKGVHKFSKTLLFRVSSAALQQYLFCFAMFVVLQNSGYLTRNDTVIGNVADGVWLKLAIIHGQIAFCRCVW